MGRRKQNTDPAIAKELEELQRRRNVKVFDTEADATKSWLRYGIVRFNPKNVGLAWPPLQRRRS